VEQKESSLKHVHRKISHMSDSLRHAKDLGKNNYEWKEINNGTIQVKEIKMLSDTITESLLDLDKCSLHKLMSILEKNAKDPYINDHQTGFGSYITNCVLKEKIGR
jgi:hypothetical protein